MSDLEDRYRQEAEADALDRAAYALFQAAGRPDTLWASLTHHEKEGWRHMALTTMNAYNQEDA